MKEIPLTRGYVALVSDEDYLTLARHKWHVVGQNRRLYAGRKIRRNGVKTTLFMHVAIMKPSEGLQVDHIDGNSLNCQRDNLRLATCQQNNHNRRKGNKPTTSQYKGVSWDKKLKQWRAWISHNNKKVYAGISPIEKEAAKLYDNKARELFGIFANLNFPNEA